MGRKVRIVHFPLEPLKRFGFKNPLLSHWALLIGQNDLLLEIFPKQGKSVFTPLNVLYVSEKVNIADRKGNFKFGIFPQADTDKSDKEIALAAKDVVRRNPFYQLVGYNCQSFVNDLAEAIAIPNFANTVKKGLRQWLPWYARRWMYCAANVETNPSPEALAQQAKAELEYLMEMGERLRSATGVETIVADVDPGQRGSEESKALKPFALKDQKYLHIEEEGLIAAGDGIVYGLTKSPAYELIGIPVPERERDFSSLKKLDIYEMALMIVGEEKSIEVN